MRHYGLLNLGRDKNPNRSTQRIDRAALRKLRDALGGPTATNAVAFLVEINEGDDNDELALAKDVFGKGWACYGESTHEPIFLTRDLASDAIARVTWVPDSAVPKWSPRRSVLEVRIPGETFIAVHPAAGPHTDGDRPEWARGPLRKSWDNTHAAHLKAKRRAHADGDNVTEMCDLNHYDLPGLPGEVTVVHHRTDYGRAWPARGQVARFRAGKTYPVGIDSHRIVLMHGTYEDR
ncbi:MAG TPA: hypothetical protein VIS06_04290 [Mycobacteriales bacterium]